MEKVITWTNKHSSDKGYVGDINTTKKHFINTTDKRDTKKFANKGLAVIAVKQLISYGEAVNNTFDIVDA